jgi:hypothetical protein
MQEARKRDAQPEVGDSFRRKRHENALVLNLDATSESQTIIDDHSQIELDREDMSPAYYRDSLVAMAISPAIGENLLPLIYRRSRRSIFRHGRR